MGVLKEVLFIIFIGSILLIPVSNGRQPHKAFKNAAPFIVYFRSRYRAICVGTLVSRKAVLTAAACCICASVSSPDIRAINMVVGTQYRHPKRGIRVQVMRIYAPLLSNETSQRTYIIEKSIALMVLRRNIPDDYVEVPLRAIEVNYNLKASELGLKQECFTVGWHFFFKGDKIYPVSRFLLQRHLRIQFIDVAKTQLWCKALQIKFQKSLENINALQYYDPATSVCVKDPDRIAQPCHGMYGAPLICSGKMVGMLTAPDAQWTNCTGMSNIFHVFSGKITYAFMTCVSKLFKPDLKEANLDLAKKIAGVHSDKNFDYVRDLYDNMLPGLDSSEEL